MKLSPLFSSGPGRIDALTLFSAVALAQSPATPAAPATPAPETPAAAGARSGRACRSPRSGNPAACRGSPGDAAPAPAPVQTAIRSATKLR